ncbi:putative pilus system protein FilA [Acinetobacter sp. HZNU-JH01]|uniref:putative pilus system protein FilA n=1 Tax=Acinetobacter sp. HZNU-JH01 TaxID=3136280 RepID=UPI0030F430A9
MKMFTKLVLVSSMAISANAMAMQSMDDAALSAATGQDGINIGIALDSTGISIDKLYLHDNDGLQTSTGITGATGVAGAIAIDGITITQTSTDNLLDLVIDTDAGTSGEAFLNIAASVGAVDISIGSIGVAPSNGASLTDTTTAVRGVTGTPTEILTGLDLSLGAISANVQLGATPQGAMIKLDSTLEGGLTISNLGINDAAGGGQIYLDNIYVRGTGNTTGDLDIDTDISVTQNGLQLKNNSTQGMNVYLEGVRLGAQATGSTNASIGDVEIQGLNVGTSTITISGH